MSLTHEATQQVQNGLSLFHRNVDRMGLERAKVQLAISFTWLDGHNVDEEDDTIQQAAGLLSKLGGSISYACGTSMYPNLRNFVEIVDGTVDRYSESIQTTDRMDRSTPHKVTTIVTTSNTLYTKINQFEWVVMRLCGWAQREKMASLNEFVNWYYTNNPLC